MNDDNEWMSKNEEDEHRRRVWQQMEKLAADPPLYVTRIANVGAWAIVGCVILILLAITFKIITSILL
jgi:hypothetical protein